jgi:lysophospholipase L1-like esterase
MKELQRNFLKMIMAVVVALLIGEGVSRLVYTKPWYDKLLEEQTNTSGKTSVRRNAFGLRGRDYPSTKPSNCSRIIILGDSFTYGSGVTNDALVFPQLLENKLNAEFSKQGQSVEILNGGISGSLTDEWVKLLQKVQDSFQPDVVLVVFFLRDGTTTSSMGSFFGPIRDEMRSKNTASRIYRYSYLVRLIQDYRDRTYLSNRYSAVLNESYLGNIEETHEWEKAKKNILKIKVLAEQKKARMALVIFPVLVELNRHYPFNSICEVITRFCAENKIPVHNLLPAFIGKNGPDLWVSGGNQHPNPVGHEIAANSILPFLRELLQQRAD